MKMKKIIAGVLAVTMTAAASIGATLAYLTDTDEDVNVMTLGNVKIDQLEYERVDDETAGEDAEVQEFHDNKPLYPAVTDKDFDYTPGDSDVDWTQIGKNGYSSEIWNPDSINNELDKMVFVKNKGKSDAYVRTFFAFEAGKYTTLEEFKAKMHLNLNETDFTWDWIATPVTIGEGTYFVATATYDGVLAPGALTEISLSQIALDKSATNADVEAFGETYQILVKTQAIQTAGFEDAAAALNEGFGTDIPWETDAPEVGATMKNALHYLNADPTGTKITSKVSNVVFGLNSAYPEIVNQYDGTLAAAEQDVPVYAYYVPNGSNYDVYFLSNDDIYAPVNSNELFYEGEAMSSLKSVKLDNLNTSRTTDMGKMFRDCSALTSVDLSGLDTGAVTDLNYLFNNCKSLTTVNVTGLDTGKVTNISAMFYNCSALKEIVGIDAWDTSSLTTIRNAFRGCSKLEAIDVSNWDTHNVTDMMAAFQDCALIQTLAVSNWDTSKVTNMTQMFNRCYALSSLDVSNWDMGNVTSAKLMFQNCTSLTELATGNWDTGSFSAVEGMFTRCSNLTELDVSGWDLSNVVTANSMFSYCLKLKQLDTSSWYLPKAQKVDSMFRRCLALEELDVSTWDLSSAGTLMGMFCSDSQNTGEMALKAVNGIENWKVGNVTTTESMFYGCGQLETLNLSGWKPLKLTSMSHMFADCYKLESIDFTGWETPSLTSMDCIFNNCEAMVSVDLSMFDTSEVVYFSQLFESCKSLEQIIGLENWDTAKGKDFSEMFTSTKLTKLDLSSFDTSSATIVYSMFNNNPLLETIYVGDGWDMSKVTSSGAMFSGCNKLTGANGTTVAGNPTDATYARVDTTETPGYLTYKAPANP